MLHMHYDYVIALLHLLLIFVVMILLSTLNIFIFLFDLYFFKDLSFRGSLVKIAARFELNVATLRQTIHHDNDRQQTMDV